ncbi:hypothetical protein DBR06_SOUSAS4110193 [Sousa chinensis]|nr:hypothetical protein DBR06_SOUSAS4110193 [Sousa chinensis]
MSSRLSRSDPVISEDRIQTEEGEGLWGEQPRTDPVPEAVVPRMTPRSSPPPHPMARVVGARALSPPLVLQEKELDGVEGPPLAGPEEDDGGEAFSFKYSPGKLRGNQYRKMMTKEELEEEQRVQKEQLAAIFKLMKDNKETFGEMSDGDVQDQLRLYDM